MGDLGTRSIFPVHHKNTTPNAQPTEIQTYEQKTCAPRIARSLQPTTRACKAQKKMRLQHQRRPPSRRYCNIAPGSSGHFRNIPVTRAEPASLLSRLPASVSLPEFTNMERIRYRLLLNKGKLGTDVKGSPSIKITWLISGAPDEHGMNFHLILTEEVAMQDWYERLSHYPKFNENINVNMITL